VLAALLAGLLGLAAGPAGAQDLAGEVVNGTLRGGTLAAPEIYSGTTVVVRDAGGAEIANVVTDDDGRWSVDLPGPGEYEVEVLLDTLPDGVGLREGSDNPQPVTVDPGQTRGVSIQFGEVEQAATIASRILPTTVQGLQFGLIIAITAIGLSLIFGTTGLVNFAHGEIVTFAAVITWFLNAPAASGGGIGIVAALTVGFLLAPIALTTRDRITHDGATRSLPWPAFFLVGWGVLTAALFLLPPGIQLIPAALLGIAASAALGAGLERGLWRPLRTRRTGLITMMVVSIGLSILLRNVLQLWFGASSRPYFDYTVQQPINIGPLSLTPKDLAVIVIALLALVGVALMLSRTRIGKAMRAVADNVDLAESSGIDVKRVLLFTWIIGGGLAGLGGVLSAADENVSFLLGFRLLLLMFSAVILGGLGTAYGALVGAIVIGLITEWSTLFFSAELKITWGLVLLIVILLVRPQGILGQKERFG
jgi:branched-chain amino acid transport system permease protein